MRLHLSIVIVGACALLAAPLWLGACDGGAGAQTAHVTPAEMPEGETWTGVYFHPVYGYLHLVEEGNSVIGRWKRADQSAWGELSGTITGNVVHYMWKEHKIGMIGPAADSHGRGYFVYKIDPTNKTGLLDGEYGIGDNETGTNWNNVKQARMQPDLKSISGDTGGMEPAMTDKWQ